MLSKNTFINKKILIYGLGISGKSCFRYLNRKNDVKVFDDDILLKKRENKLFFLNIDQILKTRFDYIIISPGIDKKKCKLKKYLITNKEKVITELDVFYINFPNNYKITITGTNGKSSTCQMLYNIFKLHKINTRLVGNIGNPPLLEKGINKKTVFIIEASSYQLLYSNYFKSDYAAIINLSADHLERHGNLNEYAKAKLKLIYNQKKKAHAYIEKNNRLINKHMLNKKVNSKIHKLLLNREIFFKQNIKNLYLEDESYLKNIHFVYAICKKFKISDKTIFKSLNLFKGLEFRKQIIYDKGFIKIINDSKSTSFSSTKSILSSHDNIYWIVGGMFKKGDKFKLKKKYYKNICAYIIGSNKNFYVKEFTNKIKYKFCGNIKDALLLIKKKIKNDKKKKLILFSPAAASFDQFKNFESRGKFFNNQIKRLRII